MYKSFLFKNHKGEVFGNSQSMKRQAKWTLWRRHWNMLFAVDLLSFWTLPIISNPDQNTAFWILGPFSSYRWNVKKYLLRWVSEKELFQPLFQWLRIQIRHKHDKANYNCSTKCYPQNKLLKFTACLLVFKIMPQYLRQSNM